MKNYKVTIMIGHNVNGRPALTTEDVIRALTSHGITAATISPAVGLWQGEREESTRIEIDGLTAQEVTVMQDTAREIAADLKQCSVWFSADPSNGYELTAMTATASAA